MKAGNWIRVRKITAVGNPDVRTASDDVYIPGGNNHVSPPIHYEIEGVIYKDVAIGEALTVLRNKRNGVSAPGIFQTSVVTEIIPEENVTTVKTRNSVYEVVSLSPANPDSVDI